MPGPEIPARLTTPRSEMETYRDRTYRLLARLFEATAEALREVDVVLKPANVRIELWQVDPIMPSMISARVYRDDGKSVRVGLEWSELAKTVASGTLVKLLAARIVEGYRRELAPVAKELLDNPGGTKRLAVGVG